MNINKYLNNRRFFDFRMNDESTVSKEDMEELLSLFECQNITEFGKYLFSIKGLPGLKEYFQQSNLSMYQIELVKKLSKDCSLEYSFALNSVLSSLSSRIVDTIKNFEPVTLELLSKKELDKGIVQMFSNESGSIKYNVHFQERNKDYSKDRYLLEKDNDYFYGTTNFDSMLRKVNNIINQFDLTKIPLEKVIDNE